MLEQEHLHQLKNICPDHIDGDSDQAYEHFKEWRHKKATGVSDLVLLPNNTSQVSKILKYCNDHNIKIFPQGGNTGLVGGSTPNIKGDNICLNLSRMNKINGISDDKSSVKLESGCIVDKLNEYLAEHNLFYPISFGATGTAQIGATVATNAGGANAVKYGVTRDMVISMKVVLADGEILELGGTLKDTAGLQIQHLFIGSEGTLGIITELELKIFPKPKNRVTIFSGLNEAENNLKCFTSLKENFADQIETFEIINKTAFEYSQKYQNLKILDSNNFDYKFYLLIELVDSFDGDILQKRAEDVFANLLEDRIIDDVIIANSLEQRRQIWNIRENISEASRQYSEGIAIYFDTAVPIYNIIKFMNGSEQIAKEHSNKNAIGIDVLSFGHFGDGNIHVHINNISSADKDKFLTIKNDLESEVLDLAINKLSGTGWAEHGIGEKNISNYRKFTNSIKLDIEESIKKKFDPNNILNPDRVFYLPDKL
jgi:D-lactate dehydrogenase (cytochrome)